MLQGDSHFSSGPVLLLGNSLCPMPRLLNVCIKAKKKTILAVTNSWEVRAVVCCEMEWTLRIKGAVGSCC